MTQRETKIFEALIHNPYISQQELADITNLSRSTVANILSDLNNQGYIIGKPYELNKKKIITCIGGANIDYKMNVLDKYVHNSSNPVSKTSSLGGVIRNVAENLARLGEDVSLMTRVGNDLEGSRIVKESSSIMYVYAVDRVDNLSTGFYIAVLDENKDLALGLSDMQICEDMNRDWILNHKAHIAVSELIVCDTNIKKSAIEALLEIKEEKKLVLIGVSVAKIKNIPDDIKNVHLMILNIDEAKAYTGKEEDDIQKICKNLREKGLKRAIITMGEKGSAFFDESIDFKIVPSKKVEKVEDVTGAGDAFSSGVIYAISKGKSIEDACKYGTQMAVLNLQTSQSVRRDISSKIFDDLY